MKKLNKTILSLMLVLIIFAPVLFMSGCDLFGTNQSLPKTSIVSITGIKTDYLVDEPFLSKTTNITIKFNNNETENKTLNDVVVTGFDTTSTGDKSMTITYSDFEYTMNYSVTYKEIWTNYQNGTTTSSWPTKYTYGASPTIGHFHVYAKTYSNRVLDFDFYNRNVSISNFDVDTLSTTAKTATITCGGKSVSFQYNVWWTQLNTTYDRVKDTDLYKLTLSSFRINTNGTVDGHVTIKNKGTSNTGTFDFATWELKDDSQTSIYIKNSEGTVVAQLFMGGDLYILGNSILFYDTSIDHLHNY